MEFRYERVGIIIEQMKKLIYSTSVPITSYKTIKSQERFQDISNLNTEEWEDFDQSMIWGGHNEFYWFATQVEIPEELNGRHVVISLITGKEGEWDATNPQFSIYVNGNLIQGLDVNHRDITLTKCAVAGERYSIVLSAYTGNSNFTLLLKSYLKALETNIEEYYYNLLVPYQVLSLLRPEDDGYYSILKVLNESINLLDLRKVYSSKFWTSLETANQYLRENLYDKCDSNTSSLSAIKEIYCVGHTHIDIAWLWTLRVTQDKAVRSFSTVLRLMEQYPEYIFMSSQPQLYAYVKEFAPEQYKQIQKRVAEGRWEVEGGMYVEADCNLTSGESLVRQFLYGKQFFREEFQKDNEILWLPDVFGYSAALPQIMNKCGIHYFMTTKISWNDTNKIPYDTFYWKGIDGSSVFTHFITTRDYTKDGQLIKTNNEHYSSFSTCYNGTITPSQMKGAWQRYQQKYLNDEVLVSYGYGDGGGGPTKEQLEVQRRLHVGIPGCPKTKQATALSFFKKLEEEVSNNKYTPTWIGELYLEYHRGTYTSMARNKKYNRKAEFALQNTEMLSIMNKKLLHKDYPWSELKECWNILLRNQFHDILPGSSIYEVYEDSRREYERLFQILNDRSNQMIGELVNSVATDKDSLVVMNYNSFISSGVVTFAFSSEKDIYLKREDETYPCQRIGKDLWLADVKNVSAKGYSTFKIVENTDEKTSSPVFENEPVNYEDFVFENQFYRLKFNEKGQLSSIYDKEARREVLKDKCCGNVFMTYEDRPHNFDAWEIKNYYDEKEWEVSELLSLTLTENGPIRKCIKLKLSYLDSVIEQSIVLYENSRRIDFQTTVDWKQSQILLKVLFPIDVHNDVAAFDIQYGNLERNTTRNTSWDSAKFEVCHHKWMDLSEDGYGVSLLNDCKYGVSVYEGNIGLSLIKSGVYPNPLADQEIHTFTYSLYPHLDGFRKANTIIEAYKLNNPLTGTIKTNQGGVLPPQYSFVTCSDKNVLVEVIKEAEDQEGTIIRLYECFNKRTEVSIRFADTYKEIYECNMLEKKEKLIGNNTSDITLTIKPYEIITLRMI